MSLCSQHSQGAAPLRNSVVLDKSRTVEGEDDVRGQAQEVERVEAAERAPTLLDKQEELGAVQKIEVLLLSEEVESEPPQDGAIPLRGQVV
jgi:hypothetical protein